MKVIVRWKMPAGPHAAARQPDFHSPLPSGLRIAVLADGFRETRWIRTFPQGLTPGMMQHEPQVIAGTIKVLRALARTIQRGYVKLPHLEYAVIVMTDFDSELLAAADRDLLWDAFGVPVYEQIIGPRGETLASECEAHNGLHIVHPDCPTKHIAAMLNVELDTAQCGCGRSGSRFVTPLPAPAAEPVPLLALSKATSAAA